MLQSEGIDVAINFVVTVKKACLCRTRTSHVVVTALMYPGFILDDNGMFQIEICSFILKL
jgi:hypothetical protein